MNTESLQHRAHNSLRLLGVEPDFVAQRKLTPFHDATDLVVAAVSRSGREHQLIGAAADAWKDMHKAADCDGVSLIIISAFRSFQQQNELVQRKLACGESAEQVFRLSAPAGYSEHHTGRAIDIGTAGCEPLSMDFETTPAYSWLRQNAARFGFRLTFGPNNSQGFDYEPWHWCFALR